MKKQILFAAVCIALLIAAVPAFAQRLTSKFGNTPPKAMFIAMDSVNVHWLKLNRGCQDQARKAKIDYVYMAPAGKLDTAQQVSIMEDAINANYDIILVAPQLATSMIPTINKAMDKGIKVIIIDTELPAGSRYDAFVGTNNEAGGRHAADQLGKLLGGKGKVAIVNAQAGAGSTMARERGFKDQMAKNFPGITIVGTQYSDGDVQRAMNITQGYITSNPDLAGIYACNENATIGVGRGVQAAGKTGVIKIVGWDKSPDSERLIMEGIVDGIICQNPTAMGTGGIQAGVDLLSGRALKSKDNDSGFTFGVKSNIAKL